MSESKISRLEIAHIVSYISQDGAYGGPVAVAMGQVAELARRGHDIELIAGWDGVQTLEIPLSKIRLFGVQRVGPGFIGLISLRLWRQVFIGSRNVDIFHIHMGRDPISLFSALIVTLRGIPFVAQTHGMVMPRKSWAVILLDTLITRRVLNSARRVLVLTDIEAEGIQQICRGKAEVELIPNGIRIPEPTVAERDMRKILFLARLHPRKRVIAFAEMCRLLRDANIEFTAHVVGPDEGDLAALVEFIEAFGLSSHIFYEGSVSHGQSTAWLSRSSVFVLPSVGEVFPMTVLEALAAGTAVVTTDDSGLAPTLRILDAAAVTDGSPEELADAVAKILTDEEYRTTLVRNGSHAIERHMSVGAVVAQLELSYMSK